MTWFFLALLAPAIDTIGVFIDKYLVEHKVKNSHCMPIYGGIAPLIFATTLWFLFGTPTASSRDTLLLLGSGVVSIFGYALYFHALMKDDASYVNAALQTTPIFILIFATVLLNQSLNLPQVLGFALVLGAVMGLSVDKLERKIKLTSSFYQILAANFFFAVGVIMIAFTAELESLAIILSHTGWGLAIGALLLFISSRTIRKAFLESYQTIGKSTLTILFASESLLAFSQGIRFLAITLGPVVLVGVLDGTQVFYGLLLGVVLTILFPKIFKESIEKRDVFRKIGFSVLLFLGILCIGVSS